MDDMARMSPESQRAAFRYTLKAIYEQFSSVYVNREPSVQELRDIQGQHQKQGFPGCIGSVDCMHLHLKNCPKDYKGYYHNSNDDTLATISCEAVVGADLY